MKATLEPCCLNTRIYSKTKEKGISTTQSKDFIQHKSIYANLFFLYFYREEETETEKETQEESEEESEPRSDISNDYRPNRILDYVSEECNDGVVVNGDKADAPMAENYSDKWLVEGFDDILTLHKFKEAGLLISPKALSDLRLFVIVRNIIDILN